MRHIFCEADQSVMRVKSSPLPLLRENEVMMKVVSTAINRADTLQRKGKYPVPQGQTDIMGLEASGYLLKGDTVDESRPVMALLNGGGYAEYVAVHKDHIMDVPQALTLQEAGGLPEVWLTAFQLLHWIGKLEKGANVLVYAGASGVGTSAIQICKRMGAHTFVTCSTPEKQQFCETLGAKKAFNYKTMPQADIVEAIKSMTGGKGVDIILDCVGPSFYELSHSAAGVDARWVQYGLMSGAMVENFNMGIFLRKRIQLIFTTLRSRSDIYKAELVSDFKNTILPHFETKELKVIIDQKFQINWDDPEVNLKFQEAHAVMESNSNTGKLVLFSK